ncbi:MAG: hypothetical protein H6712_09030 [Myxococcales bacterium]|nr:hypothetical protein [Myxococcales bacterium]MCB9713984.1 hypothetical protein [Myxococcales bacterium]
MTHARKKLLASALAAILAPASAMAVVAAPSAAQAKEVEQAKCFVHSVLASKEGEGGVPKELAFLQAQLSQDEFAIYKTFLLIEQKTFDIRRGKVTETKFSSGNRMGLSLLGNDDKRLKLHASLSSRDGSKDLLNTDYSIEDGGLLMIQAGSFVHKGTEGKLFFAIQCARSG